MAVLLEILLLPVLLDLLLLVLVPLSPLGFWALLLTLFPIWVHTSETNGSPQAFFSAVDGKEDNSDGVVGIREVVPFIVLLIAF